MRASTWIRLRFLVMLVVGCQLFAGGCLGFVQEQIEVFVAPEASATLVFNNFLVNTFGIEILRFSKFFT